MWLLNLLSKRAYERRLKAALLVLLGAYLHASLSLDEQQRVEEELSQNIQRSGDPPDVWKKWYPWWRIAAFRAAAMEKAKVSLPLPGYTWADLFQPWRKWAWFNPVPPFLKGFDPRPLFVLLDFRLMSDATADAKQLLRRHGLPIPDDDPR